MRLYNQTKIELHWDDGPLVFSWEPYGFCEVPEHIVPILQKQGVKVGVAPVAPEQIAATEVTAAQESAKNEETAALKREVEALKASVKSTEDELLKSQVELEEADKRIVMLTQALKETGDKLADATAQRDAMSVQLEAATKQLTVLQAPAVKNDAPPAKKPDAK